jgi:uncharacterized protein (TIGR02246 family)
MRVTSLRSFFLTALLVGFAPTAIVQDKTASEAVTQAVKAVHEKFSQAWNKHDGSGIAALCTTDGVFVTPAGIAFGRQEIENSYKKLFSQIAAEGFVTPVDQVQMLSGNTAMALGHWTLQSPSSQGYWTEVYELQGQEWNIRLHAHNITPPAPPHKSR